MAHEQSRRDAGLNTTHAAELLKLRQTKSREQRFAEALAHTFEMHGETLRRLAQHDIGEVPTSPPAPSPRSPR